MSKYSHRKDLNHDAIAKCAKKCGWAIEDVHEYTDFVDQLWVRSDPYHVIFVEVKNPKGRNKLEPSQVKLHAKLRSIGCHVEVVRTELEVKAITAEFKRNNNIRECV